MSGKKSKKKSQGKNQSNNDKNGKKKAKPSKKGAEGRTKSAKSRFHLDIFTDDCMENYYYICHNVQDVLKFRGFSWPDLPNKKKGKKGK